MEPRLSARRLVERRRGGSCGGICPGCGRHRHRRLDPRAGRGLRHRRAEADLWPGEPPRCLSEHLHDGPLRPAGPQRRGHCAVPAGHRRLRCRGPGQRRRPGAGLRGGFDGVDQRPRLGLVEHWYAHGAHPDLPPAMSAAVEVLRGLGAIVEPVQLSSLRDYTDCKTTISIAELYAIHEKDLKTRPQDFGRILRNRVLPGALIRAEDYVQALRWRTVLAREQAMALKQFDALLTAGALGVADPADPNQPDRLVSVPSITMPFSVGGLPAIAIPCGFSRAEGLPLSLQIAAAPMAEPTVLRIAHAYQQATDWHRRHPDLR